MEWEVADQGPARCSLVDDGCRVQISGEPYTLYSTVRFPSDARYCLNWDVHLESRLDRGALGLSLGNEKSGLIFQVTDGEVAQVLSYRKGRKPQIRMSRYFGGKNKEYELDVAYDIRNRHCSFTVNGETVFDFSPRELPNLSMASSVRHVAVTTATVEGKRKALALHRRVGIKAR